MIYSCHFLPWPVPRRVKIFRTVLAVLMLAFAFVQLNDPDGLVWMLVYGAVAVALVLSAWAAGVLAAGPGRLATVVLVLGLAAMLVTHWPAESGFWRQDVWWQSETAREGMGLGIAFAASLFVLPAAFGGNGRQPIA